MALQGAATAAAAAEGEVPDSAPSSAHRAIGTAPVTETDHAASYSSETAPLTLEPALAPAAQTGQTQHWVARQPQPAHRQQRQDRRAHVTRQQPPDSGLQQTNTNPPTQSTSNQSTLQRSIAIDLGAGTSTSRTTEQVPTIHTQNGFEALGQLSDQDDPQTRSQC